MEKTTFCLGLVACLLNLGAVASVTTDLLALRAARSADVVPGVWHSDLNKARAYAEANGLPLVAVWSNGDYCNHCIAFENCVMSAAFRNWMTDSGVVFYFGEIGDNTSDGQEGYHGTSFYWCCNDQNATMNWPYVRVWWPQGDVDECHSGSWYDGDDEGKILLCTYSDNRTDPDNFIYPGDYGTYNPGGRRIISVLVGNATASAAMPEGGGVAMGGLLAGFAKTEEVGGYTWRYRINGDGAEICGIVHEEYPSCEEEGVSYWYTPAISPEPTGVVEVPSTLGGYPVTSITMGAFYGCSGLTDIRLPEGLEILGVDSFSNCSGLGRIELPDGVTVLWGAPFNGCGGLTNVVIGSGLTELDPYVFGYCDGLTRFDVAADNPQYKSVNGLILTKDGKTLIRGVNGEVQVPSGVTCVGDGAFYGSGRLTGVVLPDGVEIIDEEAFMDCSSLDHIEIPDSVTEIGSWAFDGCSDALFDTMTVPGVRLVDGWAVEATESLSAFLDLSGVRGIGDSAFEDCGVLESVEIPPSVAAIGNYSFYGCDGLEYVGLPDGLKSLGEGAFEGCCSLESISIPDSVDRIEWGAFCGCENLSSVTFKGDMAAIDMNVFSVFEGTPWLESYIATLPRPVNDDFTNATVIAGTSGSVTGSNAAATFEEDEPYDYGDHGTVWWRWTAPVSGTAVFDTRDSGFNANTAVFTGDKLSELEEIAINGDRQSGNCYAYTSRIEFEAKKGVTYSIAVGGYKYGTIVLDWEMKPSDGSCLRKVMALRPSQEITLVNEYDEENSEFLDDGVCCFKVTLTRGRAYTIGISGGDVADMDLLIDADYDAENVPFAEFYFEPDDANGVMTAYLEADYWDEDDPPLATFYVCVRGEVGQNTMLYFSHGIQKLPAVAKSDDGKVVEVPTTWVEARTERTVTASAANGRKVWECYVLGLDPEDAAADFKIVSLPMKADGTPDLENIVFEPAPGEWNMPTAQPVLKGATSLDGPWETVRDGNEASFRFFKVAVELP